MIDESEFKFINEASVCITLDSFISCFDCSPNGLAIACVNGNIIRIYDIQSGTQMGQDMIGHSEAILDIRYSINGDLLFSGGEDHAIIIWNTKTYQQDGISLIGHHNDILSLAISPDGIHIASSSQDKTIRIWDINARTCQSVIQVFIVNSLQYRNQTLQYSKSGHQLSYLNDFQIKTVHMKLMISRHIYSPKLISTIQFNDHVLVSATSEQAQIQDKLTGKYIRKSYHGFENIDDITTSQNKKFFAILCANRMYVYDTQRGLRYGPFIDDDDHLFYDVKFSKDSKSIILSTYSSVLKCNISEILKA